MKEKQQQQKQPKKKVKADKIEKQIQQENLKAELQKQEQSSNYSSEDQDAFLLTEKVQEKLLETVARLKSRDPSIYKLDKNIFDQDDFKSEQNKNKNKNKINDKSKKFTYKDMLTIGASNSEAQSEESDDDKDLPPAMQEKKAVNKFKQAMNKQKSIIQSQKSSKINNNDDLFVVKGKVTEKNNLKQKQTKFIQDKYQTLTKKIKPVTKKLLKNVWEDPQKMDTTDFFLKDYILNKKWLSKHLNNGQQNEQIIDQEDEERSLEMDEYEAKYNFRFEEPQGDKIVQYPRKIEESMRIMPETRKDKRKKTQKRKKNQEKQIREEAQIKKSKIKNQIIEIIQNKNDGIEQESDNFQNDWFFCDDCGKAFEEEQVNYQCAECQDYMLCEQCNDLIIHKHLLIKGQVPEGNGAPKQSIRDKYLSFLQPCKTCRRKLPQTVKHFQYKDRSDNSTLMCEKCYDESGLDVKKKFSLVQAKININKIEQILEKDPQKVKELTNSQEIQEMIDEYLKYEFEDVIGDGLKTKFKYINVKPEDYGLSDEQILFGDDRQLNKYISVKKLAPYQEQNLRLRNNIFKKKVTSINKSVKYNKNMVVTQAGERRIKKSRMIDKLKSRSEAMKKKRQTKLKILNISNPIKEKQTFVPSSRLASYGVTLEKREDKFAYQQSKNQDKKRNGFQKNNQSKI